MIKEKDKEIPTTTPAILPSNHSVIDPHSLKCYSKIAEHFLGLKTFLLFKF